MSFGAKSANAGDVPFFADPSSSVIPRDAATRSLAMMLNAGGDERLAIDPLTGRNRYGIPGGAAGDEIWFSSSTASDLSRRGHDAVCRVLARASGELGASALVSWFEGVRERLLTLFGVLGADAIFCASGTEAELVALCLARSSLANALTNIVVAPQETGRGVTLAAAGRHFLDTAPFALVERGQVIKGLGDGDGEVATVEIRDARGAPIGADAVDRAVEARVRAIIQSGRDVLLHVLDSSKTGLSGFSRTAAAAQMAAYPGRILCVVDACQLRCSQARIRADLDAGFMVAITGSKFAGGPPFSGALLVPPWIAAQDSAIVWPEGLAAYSAARDWPPRLRARITGAFGQVVNPGLGLRWEAALAEIERYFAIDDGRRTAIAARFRDCVHRQVEGSRTLEMAASCPADNTIIPIFTVDRLGRDIPAESVRRVLLNPRLRVGGMARGKIFHAGQPVPIGDRDALRVCLSAPLVVDVAAHMAQGLGLEAAFEPVAAELRALFTLWRATADTITGVCGHG
jgi:hypothetical protein